MKNNTLTKGKIIKLGLDKVDVITSDMLDGYTSIGEFAFRVCKNLKSITIPNSITKIGACAFDYNISLNSITIPNSVVKIGDFCFDGCRSLKQITIPKSVTSIGRGAFYSCYNLQSIVVESGNKKYDSRENCNAIIETSTNTLIVGCKKTIIPNSVKSIGNGAFFKCIKLKSINIPESITNILKYSFYKCENLKTIVIGNNEYKVNEIVDGKCKAYKAFHADMTCFNGYLYREGKTYEIDGKPELCKRGLHACLNLLDVFNYYNGEIGKDVVVHEVELEGVSEETSIDDSKVVAKKMTIGKRIL